MSRKTKWKLWIAIGVVAIACMCIAIARPKDDTSTPSSSPTTTSTPVQQTPSTPAQQTPSTAASPAVAVWKYKLPDGTVVIFKDDGGDVGFVNGKPGPIDYIDSRKSCVEVKAERDMWAGKSGSSEEATMRMKAYAAYASDKMKKLC
ncbi:hypothetical protein ACIBSW_34515 [Actinoplanes sp. NPDC049668]|uniref:hypothetical protein n=1 Tax=unclassified Actinoplanes TaxID=2626549 RepID=UPI0033B52823